MKRMRSGGWAALALALAASDMQAQRPNHEQLLMFAAFRLGDAAHGLALRHELEEATGRKVSPGAVYTTMDRLERQGLVSSWIGEDRPVGGGRRRKFYRLEPAGARALADSYASLATLAEGTLPGLRRLATGAGGAE